MVCGPTAANFKALHSFVLTLTTHLLVRYRCCSCNNRQTQWMIATTMHQMFLKVQCCRMSLHPVLYIVGAGCSCLTNAEGKMSQP